MKGIIVGASKVGKTKFVSDLIQREYPAYIPTYGVDTNHIGEHTILDTSGKKLYSSIIKSFYNKADLLIFMYNSVETFATIESYVKPFTGKVIVLYNGTDENVFELGLLYKKMYQTPCFQCMITKHTWEQILQCMKPAKKPWRYCLLECI